MHVRSTAQTSHISRRLLVFGIIAALVSMGCLHTRTPSVATSALAPAFSLSDSTGKQVSLAELTTNGPAVVVFYRGYW